MAAIDPVCYMEVDEKEAAATYTHNGKSFYFCAVMCRDRFAENPERFLNGELATGASENLAPVSKAAEGENDFIRIELPIRGMSCASCVERIETGLSKLGGVQEVSVNFAAEKGTVLFDSSVLPVSRLVREVENLGYEARVEEAIIPIRGMSCASCVDKIETQLRALPGVIAASVNFGTEKASVRFLPSAHSVSDLRKAIREIGYEPLEMAGESAAVDYEKEAREKEIRELRLKTAVGGLLSIPLLLGMLSEWLPMPEWLASPYVQFLLATPVHLWVGWQFHVGFWKSLRHKTADMNTLVSVGTNAGYIYSVLVTFTPRLFAAGGLTAGVYFETEEGHPYTSNDIVLASVSVPEERTREFPFTRLAGRGRVVRVEEIAPRGESGRKRFGIALEFGQDLTALSAIPSRG